jgi:hypothetical protein
MMEFENLKARLRKADEYFRTTTDTDTSKAEETVEAIKTRLNEVWGQMSLTINLDPDKTADQWMRQIQDYEKEQLFPVKLIYYSKSNRAVVRMEHPAWWKESITEILEA